MRKEVLDKYAGKWVAILKNRVVATGNSVREVMSTVKQKEIKELPLVTRVLRKDEETCVL